MAKYAIVRKEFTITEKELFDMDFGSFMNGFGATDGFECTETEIYEYLEEAKEEFQEWHTDYRKLNSGMYLCSVSAIAKVSYNQIFERVEEDGEVVEFEYGEITKIDEIIEYAKPANYLQVEWIEKNKR